MLNYLDANMNESSDLSGSIKNSHFILFELLNNSSKIKGIGSAWYVEIINGDTIIGHNGFVKHRSYMKFNKNKKYGLVALSNSSNLKLYNLTKIFNLLD